ncbi:hypothetical protein [Desulfovibrio sp. TomC]|uniref:hypothetical protein n=1 Tax=Desulfovibrio sp. TomC TaxID=1562888 RepID=UPI0005743F25|nr:hypothetical protein [Desulfovibrio sp. TomC]KHK01028.1 Large repetitive protein [Desulfovibrio sp. TomC]
MNGRNTLCDLPAFLLLPALSVLLLLVWPASALPDSMTVPFVNNDWKLVITMEPDGDMAMNDAIAYKMENDLPSVRFQAQGKQKFTVTAVYTGSVQGTAFFDVAPYTVAPTLNYTANPGLKEGEFTSESWYTGGQDGWNHWPWIWEVRLELRDSGGFEIPGTFAGGYLTLNIIPFRYAWLEYTRLCVSDVRATALTAELVSIGPENYTLTSESPVEINPKTVAPEAYYYASYAGFTLYCPLAAFDTGPIKTKVTAEGGGAPPISQQVTVPFARVEESDRGVWIKNQLSGEWSELSNGGPLAKGDLIKMAPVPWYDSVWLPHIVVQFADGQIREVTLEPGYDQSQAGELIIEVGQGALLTHNVAWTIKFTNFIQERTNNPREYAKEYVWDTLGDALFNFFAPGSSWPIKKIGGEIIEYGLEKVYGATGGDGAQRFVPRPSVEDIVAETRTMRAGSRGNRPSSRPTAHAAMAINSNGSMTVENRIGTRRAVNASQQTRLLPPRTQVSHTSFFGQVTNLPYPGTIDYPFFTVTPADGSFTSSCTPLVTFSYKGYDTKFIPETLDVRINGRLVNAFISRGEAAASLRIPYDSALSYGSNTVEASIMDAISGRIFVTTTFFASGTPQAPSRLVATPAATSMLLHWQPGQTRGLSGYHVYKGDTADTITTRLTTTPIAGQVYALYAATEPGLASGAYFAVSAVVDGTETALSTPVQGSLAGPAAAAPAPITDLAAATSYEAITLNWTPPAGARVYRISRGGMDDLILRDPPFVDATAGRGINRSYTVTPLGLNLAAGTTATVTATVPATTPPPAPTGFTAYAADAENKIWNLRWDPARAAGIASWRVYESRNGEAYALVAQQAAGELTLARTLTTPGPISWHIAAVSDAGMESAAGPACDGGYATAVVPATMATSAGTLLLLRE